MKIGPIRISAVSLTALALQLILVLSVAGKYLFQRFTCPRVWTRAGAVDPQLLLRGRYLRLQLTVDGCGSTLPSAKQAQFGRNLDGSANNMPFAVAAQNAVPFQAVLGVQDQRLTATRIEPLDDSRTGQTVWAFPQTKCSEMQLAEPVDFYLPEHAANPIPYKAGTELWVEVTVPPKGPPRPLQLALKQDGIWKPLAFN